MNDEELEDLSVDVKEWFQVTPWKKNYDQPR